MQGAVSLGWSGANALPHFWETFVMARMRYGPRFRSSAVSVGHRYDTALERAPYRFQWMTEKQRAFANAKGCGATKASKKRVGMPTFSWSPPVPQDERAVAEKRMIKRIKQAVSLIEFSLVELTQIANPTKTYKNLVNQLTVLDALRKLCNCVDPPIKLDKFDASVAMAKPTVTGFHTCVGCGGPGRIEFKGEWFCEDCREVR
jgi:hypothetical protein